MAKKNNQIDENEEFGTAADETPVVTNEEQIVEPTTDETPVDAVSTDEETPTPDPVDDTPVPTPDPEPTPDPVPVDDTPVPTPEPVEKKVINEYKKFNIRFGFSIDSRSTTGRKSMSTVEIVKQFVAAPTCFIALESEEDLNEFKEILAIKEIKVSDKDGKLVDFSEKAKEHFAARVTEHSNYWISKNKK